MAINPNLRGGVLGLPGQPAQTNSANSLSSDLNALVPGIGLGLQTQMGNINDLLAGTESPAISRNLNAYWGAGSGLAPGSEFLNNRGIDLYGQRGAARKAQGGQDLLALLGSLSGPATSYRGQDINQGIASADRSSRDSQFGQTLGFEKEQWQKQLELLPQLLGLAGGGGGPSSNPSNPLAPGAGTGMWDPYSQNLNDWSLNSQAWNPTPTFNQTVSYPWNNQRTAGGY